MYKNGGGFEARVRENGSLRSLGTFRTTKGHARKRAEAEAAEAKVVVVPLTADEVRAAAAGSGSDKVREGLVNSAWAVHT